MDVKVIEEAGRREIEVTVRCAPQDPRAARIVNRLRAATGRLFGYAEDGSMTRQVISLDEVLFIETSEKRAWIFTRDGRRLESPLRLFELEVALEGTEFVRASRQALVNFERVEAIRPEPNGRLMLQMEGGEFVLATRSYAGDIKKKIGVVH